MSKTDTLEVDFLKWCTGQATSYIASGSTPITGYVGLFTTAPTDSTAGTECSGTNYARVNSSGKWATPTSGSPSSVANNAVITFPTAGAGGWGDVVAFGIFNAASGGTLLRYGSLTTKTVASGDTPSFAVSALTLTED